MKYIDVEKFMQINIGDYDGIIVVKNTIPNNFLHYYIVFLPIELNNIPNNDIFNTKVYYEHILQTYNITSLNTFIRELNRKYWLRTNKLNYNKFQVPFINHFLSDSMFGQELYILCWEEWCVSEIYNNDVSRIITKINKSEIINFNSFDDKDFLISLDLSYCVTLNYSGSYFVIGTNFEIEDYLIINNFIYKKASLDTELESIMQIV